MVITMVHGQEGREDGCFAAIGVVIPAYNAAAYVGATLDSVRAQTRTDWVCVVVDDGSTDGTRAIISGYATGDSRIHVVARANGGMSAARNTGLVALPSAIDKVMFLDADDLLEPHALNDLSDTLEQTPDAVAASGLSRAMSADGSQFSLHLFGRGLFAITGGWPQALADDKPVTFATTPIACHIHTSGCVLIRRRALEVAGTFDESGLMSEDWDMWVRLSLLGSFARVNVLVLSKRASPGSLSGQRSRMRLAEPALRRRWARDLTLTPQQRRLLRLAWVYGALMRFRWARESLRNGQIGLALRQTKQGFVALSDFLVGTLKVHLGK